MNRLLLSLMALLLFNFSFAQTDVTRPTVTSVSPGNLSLSLDAGLAVSAVFSEAMNASTITAATFELRNALTNGLVPAVITYNAATKTARLSPTSLLNSIIYSVKIKGGTSGVKDLAGNYMASDYNWNFLLLPLFDFTQPSVLSVTPAGNATGVPTSSTVLAQFSEEMAASTVNTSTFELRNTANVLMPATISYNASARTAVLTPSGALATGMKYTATIKSGNSGVKDARGNTLAANYAWSFTTAVPTGDVTPPTVSSVSPANTATGVALGTAVSAVFSEAMNATTVTASTVQLRNASATVITAAVAYNAGTKTATLTPSSALAYSTTYTATVKGGASGVKDAAGNALVNNYAWTFTTLAPPDVTPPTVSSVSPVNGATGVAANIAVSGLFSEAMNAATITASTVELRNAANALATSTVTYNATTRTVTLTPSSALAYSTAYTVTVKGGASGVKDAAGNALVNNYTWSFTTMVAPDVTSPTVSPVSPLNGATGVSVSTTVSALFSETMNAATITLSNVELRNAANALVTATVTYNASAKTVTLTPAASLANGTVYTATIKGGASGVKDAAGNAMTANYSWSFTTYANTISLFNPTDVPQVPLVDDDPVELGFRFRTSQNGYITGIKFYKGIGNEGTHIGHLWSNTGVKLAEVTFTQETSSGWQQILFSSPVAITAGTTYVASYYSSAGLYAYTNSYFTSPIVNGPLTALADGQDGGNGLFGYSPASIFPANSYMATNYFVDILFTTSAGPDVWAPLVASTSPVSNATNVSVGTAVTAVFNEAMNAATVNSSTIELRNGSNALVPASISYNAATYTATLTPSSSLAYTTAYTIKIKSGASGVKDAAGNALAADYTSSFTTTTEPLLAPTEGPGGPILVVSNTSNPFSRYAVEILRAEGLNQFAAADVSTLTSTLLNSYDVVVLGEMTVTAAQVTLLTNWVNAGGTLIAFKPSALLTPLMGLAASSSTLTDKYLLVNTSPGPGAGIVNQTIQFHGVANLHALSGATSLATLYSNASTATAYPAVTTRTVGANGGVAVAFTYDLAKSIIYTRQGNPAWAGQKRDGQIDPIRSDDLFFPDWVDFNKIAIPQADEQQRLLANIILQSNLHRMPLPRFWYLPRDLKAAIVMTGDDHASDNGTAGRFGQYTTLGPNTAQDVADWKAVRGTSYIYPNASITNTQAASFEAQGFEVALHPTTNCENYTLASLQATYTTQLGMFASNFPGVTAPVTNRTHCLVWSDWASTPKVEVQNGIRLNTNYYYWPAAWVQNRPGMFTGSGMPMRFADLDGSLIDNYQLTTQMTDESGIDVSGFCNQVLDKAIGAEGYYGVFCANMHTDIADHPGSNAIIASAQARQIPVISAKQMLTWLDGRNNSFFSNLSWSNNQLKFNIMARSGAKNLKSMLPLYSATGQLNSITMNGSPVTYTIQTIKGMQYAFFPAATGNNAYVASYSGSLLRTTPQTITMIGTTPVKSAEASPEVSAEKLEARVMPNPSSTYFNLVINSNEATPVTVRILDILGQSVEKYEKISSGTTLKIGQSLNAGTYFAEIIQGGQRKVIKLIKAN